jgi:type VI protein secretion system component Hcp
MNKTIKVLTILVIAALATGAGSVANAAAFMKYDGIDGETLGPDGSTDWFKAHSFSLGVEREMKESGEKGGTEDINIGVGELQECTISKGMDLSSAKLAQAAADGRSLGRCEVCLTASFDAAGTPVCYLHYVMERCYVSNWKTEAEGDDQPIEEVAFYYNKIAFGYVDTDAEGNLRTEAMAWDNVKNREWPEGEDEALDFPLEPPPPR